MNDPFDEELKNALTTESGGEIPDFEAMWNRAEKQRKKITIIKISAFAGVVVLLAGAWISGIGKPSPSRNVDSFCAIHAVDDWFIMMDSEFYQTTPSDDFFAEQNQSTK